MLEKDGIRDYNKHKLYTFSSKGNVMLRQEYQDIRAALSAVDEVLKNISALDKASDEGELNRILPALLASMGRYAAADRAYLFGWTR